jgi:hypothetical protein
MVNIGQKFFWKNLPKYGNFYKSGKDQQALNSYD